MNNLQGAAAPDFSFPDLDAQTVSLQEWQGAPVVLNFFTENCAWCRTQLPHLADVYRRTNHVDAQVLGVMIGEANPVAAREFAIEHALDFPIVLDAARETVAAFQIARVPTVVFVDENGIIARVYEGATEQLAGIVEQTILAAAGRQELPEYSLVGNGCSPNDKG